MRKPKIYMDNCCYNRLYDDQANPKVLLSQPFDYTEWRKTHLFVGMSVTEISDAADDIAEKIHREK